MHPLGLNCCSTGSVNYNSNKEVLVVKKWFVFGIRNTGVHVHTHSFSTLVSIT